MQVRPVSTEVLVEELADRFADDRRPVGRLRVAIDGPAAATPGALAGALSSALRARGRPAVHVSAADFLRPASLRLEFGRTNPDSFYAGWVDEAGLRREVLDPAGPLGSGRIVTRLWNAATDRAAREPYRELPQRAVVLVSGPLLLGAGLPFDVTVHLALSPAALARRTDPAEQWTLPAFARYAAEVDPAAFADVVVRLDDPQRPAVVLRHE
ncbi:uridine kinase [Actinoplanes sp. NPDC051346]|uniref:uridine kinase n=1 Tax=Actinoplanes sp. NPDC051346 TaxID=3155048 RepID=UPI00343C2FA6